MLGIIIPLSAIALFLYIFLYNHYKQFRHLPPGPLSLPFIGNLHQLDPTAPHKQLKVWGKQYNGLYTIQFGAVICVVITDVQLLREALVKNAEAFSGRASNFMNNFFSNGKYGILSSDGALWRHNRRFALHTLRDFGVGKNMMEAKIMRQTDWLTGEVGTHAGTGHDYDFDDDLQMAVASIITDILLNCVVYNDRDEFFDLVHRLEQNFALFRTIQVLFLDIFPWLRHTPILDGFNYKPMRRNLDVIQAYFRRRIEDRERLYDPKSEQEPSDFIEAYLLERHRMKLAGEDVSFLSNQELQTIVIDLWLAGMETTVTTLKWAMLYMIREPEIQTRCRAEIHAELGCDTPVTLADRQHMPFTMATINEVQRLANIVPINLFHTTTQNVTIGGHFIPAGQTIIPQISAVLSEAAVFEHPDEFRPERFLLADMKTANKEALENLIPFGLGKRQCLGESLARAELFMLFVTLLQKFTFSAIPDQPTPSDVPVFGATSVPIKYKMRVMQN